MKPSFDWLLVLVPVAIVLEITRGPDLAIFLTAALAILPLAGLIGRSTEQLALHTGPRVGGLINATFGNVTELIIAIFLLMDDKVEIVKASLTGSIATRISTSSAPPRKGRRRSGRRTGRSPRCWVPPPWWR